MLEILFPKKRGCRECLEMKKGVSWQFCCFPKEVRGYDAYFNDGEFVVTNELVTFRALDDNNTIYEVKLSALEEGKIRFEVPYRKPLHQGSPLKAFENENREIDMAAFIKTNPTNRITICERVVEPESEEPYTETLQMEIDTNRDILRFYLTVTYRTPALANVREIMSYWKETCRIKFMTLDNEITFDFENNAFMEVMKKILDYCEKNIFQALN